jgi:hypothetical protein
LKKADGDLITASTSPPPLPQPLTDSLWVAQSCTHSLKLGQGDMRISRDGSKRFVNARRHVNAIILNIRVK